MNKIAENSQEQQRNGLMAQSESIKRISYVSGKQMKVPLPTVLSKQEFNATALGAILRKSNSQQEIARTPEIDKKVKKFLSLKNKAFQANTMHGGPSDIPFSTEKQNRKLPDANEQSSFYYQIKNGQLADIQTVKHEVRSKTVNKDRVDMTPDEKRQMNSSRQYLIKKEQLKGSKRLKPKVRSPHNSIQQSGMPVFSALSAESYKSAPAFVQFSTQLTPDYHVKKLSNPREEPEPQIVQANKKWTSMHKSNSQSGFPFRTFNSVTMSKIPKIPAGFKNLLNNTSNEFPKKSKSKPKKVIPLAKVKLIKLKESKEIPEKGQPKPPLANKKPVQKQNFCVEDLTSEALLKMADEGLAKLDQQIRSISVIKQRPYATLQQPENVQLHQTFQELQKNSSFLNNAKPEINGPIKQNFNLSFNNSFNTSFAGIKQKTDSEPTISFLQENQDINGLNTINQGQITIDVANLETKLTARLGKSTTQEERIVAVHETFAELIERDRPFGSLLLKIKQAYTDFLKETNEEGNGGDENPDVLAQTIEQMQKLLELTQEENHELKQSSQELEQCNKSLQNKLAREEQALANLKKQNDQTLQKFSQLKEQNEVLKNQLKEEKIIKKELMKKQIQTCGSITSVKKKQSDATVNYELSCSYLSEGNKNEDLVHVNENIGPGDEQKLKALKGLKSYLGSDIEETDDLKIQNEQLLEDVDTLVQQNFELNAILNQINDETIYLKLREKKIKYLLHLLHERGYPVHQVFTKSVQNIETLRFDEFLHQKELEAQRELEMDAQNQFSFNESDSYDLLVQGPAILPGRPQNVPELCLQDLPEYVTTSEEEDQASQSEDQMTNEPSSTKQKLDYNQSLKYIEDYYKKNKGQDSDSQREKPSKKLKKNQSKTKL